MPCIVVPKPANEAERRAFMFCHNQMHCPPTDLETAKAITDQMSLTGCTQGEAAERLQVPEPKAAKAMRVLKWFPADLHHLIGEGEGKIPFSCAYLLTQTRDEARVRELADRCVKGLMTRKRLEDILKGLKGQKTKKEPPVKVTLVGAVIQFTTSEISKAKAALAQATAALGKLEKDQYPMTFLPQTIKQ